MEECVFCDIVAGRAPASVVYRDDVCIAFMDITPIDQLPAKTSAPRLMPGR